jgi:hypothetical protein
MRGLDPRIHELLIHTHHWLNHWFSVFGCAGHSRIRFENAHHARFPDNVASDEDLRIHA